MTARSLLDIFTSSEEGIVDHSRDVVNAGYERHSDSRWNNHTYPQRTIRTHQYLYIRNFALERWPDGTLRRFENWELTAMHIGYHDIDAAPILNVMTENLIIPHVGILGNHETRRRHHIRWPVCVNTGKSDPGYSEFVAANWMELLFNWPFRSEGFHNEFNPDHPNMDPVQVREGLDHGGFRQTDFFRLPVADRFG